MPRINTEAKSFKGYWFKVVNLKPISRIVLATLKHMFEYWVTNLEHVFEYWVTNLAHVFEYWVTNTM